MSSYKEDRVPGARALTNSNLEEELSSASTKLEW
jgi:hypothetical protein